MKRSLPALFPCWLKWKINSAVIRQFQTIWLFSRKRARKLEEAEQKVKLADEQVLFKLFSRCNQLTGVVGLLSYGITRRIPFSFDDQLEFKNWPRTGVTMLKRTAVMFWKRHQKSDESHRIVCLRKQELVLWGWGGIFTPPFRQHIPLGVRNRQLLWPVLAKPTKSL